MKLNKFLSFLFWIAILNLNAQNILINQSTSVAVAGGELFYDAGGSVGNDGNTDYTMTLTPSLLGNKICLDFTYFKTTFLTNNIGPNDEDALFIYDGITASGSSIGKLMGDYSWLTDPYSSPIGVGINANSTSAAVLTPTIFCATNPSGSLTVQFKNGSSLQSDGWVASVISYTPPSAPQCNIQLTADTLTICAGESVNLTASGTMISDAITSNFNNSAVHSGWSVSNAASYANSVCTSTSLDGSTFLWMKNQIAPRELKTAPIDVSNGGILSFEYRQATNNGDASPCDAPGINSSSENEGVYVQFSTDGGITWKTMKYIYSHSIQSTTGNSDVYNNGCGDYVTNWTKMVYPIPTSAKTLSTQFRWIQAYSDNTSSDNWGLDNVQITAQQVATITLRDAPSTGAIIGSSTTDSLFVKVSPQTTTIYEATISDGISSCSFPLTVVVHPTPLNPVVSNIAYCLNDSSVSLTASNSPGNTLNWYGQNQSGGIASLTAPTPSTSSVGTITYYVSQSNSDQCESQRSAIDITTNAYPVLITHAPSPVCEPVSIDLSIGSITQGSTNGSSLSYWKDSLATIPLLAYKSIDSTGTYYIQSTLNNCSTIKSIAIVVDTTPALAITNPAAVCIGYSVDITLPSITAGSFGNGTLTYWSDPLATIPLLTPNAIDSAGTYYIKSTRGNCSDISSVVATINPLPTLKVGIPKVGCVPNRVDLTDTSLTSGSSPGSIFYYWTDANATQSLSTPTAVSDGTYYITAMLEGCISTPSPVNISLYPLPKAAFTPSSTHLSTLNPLCTMKNESEGATTYFWDFGDGYFSDSIEPTHLFPDNDTATFMVSLIAYSEFGCADTTENNIQLYEDLVYFIPNTFTPDGDNYNNTFQPVFVSGFDPYSFSMFIYNRWGEIVFETHDAKIGWKGTYGTGNKIAEDGIYSWKINLALKSDGNQREITGHVNLVR